jgi:hypothetical protein
VPVQSSLNIYRLFFSKLDFNFFLKCVSRFLKPSSLLRFPIQILKQMLSNDVKDYNIFYFIPQDGVVNQMLCKMLLKQKPKTSS